MSYLRTALLAGFTATASLAAAQTEPAILAKLEPQFGPMRRSVLGDRPNCISFLSNPNKEERAFVHVSDLNGNGQADAGEPVAEISMHKNCSTGTLSLHVVPDKKGGYVVMKNFLAYQPSQQDKKGSRYSRKSQATGISGTNCDEALDRTLYAFPTMEVF